MIEHKVIEQKIADPKISDVQAGYDCVAEEYVRHLYDELRHKPLDRQSLDRFADGVRGEGLVCDLGCGPGQVARYLYERGLAVCGVDLSPGMVAQARRLNPGIEFCQGDMKALDVANGSWAGITAFYAVVNLSPSEVELAFAEMARALRPRGLLLLSFHIGEDVLHVEDLWGCHVCLNFYFFRTNQVQNYLRNAGFEIEDVMEREPYDPEVEYPSRRAYIFARKHY